MQATNRKDMRIDKFLLSLFLGLALLLACSFGCAPSSSPEGDSKQSGSASSTSNGLPEITDEKIREEINDAFVRDVPEENGTSEPINWSFDEDEPKELTVADKQLEDGRATIIIDIKTQSAPRSRSPRQLTGQIRTKWELKTGWALRTWEIVETENVSMKYKNLPKPTAQNSNR